MIWRYCGYPPFPPTLALTSSTILEKKNDFMGICHCTGFADSQADLSMGEAKTIFNSFFFQRVLNQQKKKKTFVGGAVVFLSDMNVL